MMNVSSYRVFGDHNLNIDQSGKGDLALFRSNVQRWSSPENAVVHQGVPLN